MSMRTRRLRPVIALLLLFGCLGIGGRSADAQAPASITILHFNDVYEIDAVEGGHAGGLSRVATIRDQLRRRLGPLLTTLGGDFLAPSAIGTARVDGQPLAGRQMVAVLNGVGLDWATFGNHEFDVSEEAFHARLAEARFHIVSSNVTDANGLPFAGTVRSAVFPMRAGGREVRIGLIGLTLDANQKPWVRYRPVVEAAREQVEALKGRVDALVALTHLSLEGDQDLVTQVPGIDLVLGGHEHENWLLRRGPDFTPIVKADANVRSVAVVTVTFSGKGVRPTVSSRLQVIGDRVPRNPKIEAEVRRWTTMAFDGFKRDGFAPDALVATIPEPLDGREATVRNVPGRLTDLIVASHMREAGAADVGLLNGGAIRVDDVILPGAITEYDIIRVLPFGGKVLRVVMDGSLLARVLDVGASNAGTGGYVHTSGISRQGDRWLVKGNPLDPAARYAVAMNDFLLTGLEVNLGFLVRTSPQVHDVQEFRDVRRALIDELRADYPGR